MTSSFYLDMNVWVYWYEDQAMRRLDDAQNDFYEELQPTSYKLEIY